MGPRLVLREGLLRRDNVDKGWGEEAYPPQVHP
jgi:predicted DNA-binding transcriptional regulator